MSRKKWIISPIDKDAAAQVAENHSLDPFTSLILVSRGITEYEDVEEFFDNDFSFCDPYLITDMDKAVERIKKAIENFEKICVYGDYDADGVTSTAIMYSYFSKHGADVIYYIPDRITEGYGMSCSAVDKLRAEGVKLIVTVDNGISAVKEIAYAKELGIDCVVTDHHMPGEVLPDAVAVVDPHRTDCNLLFRDWAGVGVAFKTLCALENGSYWNVLNEYADIIAVGTVADVVDLKDENRAIVKYGLAKINSSPCNGINALRQVAGAGERSLNATGVTYSLAPRINAAGRMESAVTALKLLLCDDLLTALDIAEKTDECNRRRHLAENEIMEAAVAVIEADNRLKYSRVLVVCGENWHHGVIGIVAARLCEKYGRPAIVITFEGDEGTGSARSIEGFPIYDAIKSCSEVLTHFGGHEMAAGLGLKKENVDAFFSAVNEYAASREQVFPVLQLDCKLNPAYINNDLVQSLEMLEPFGAGNPQPLFGIFGVRITAIRPVGEGKHIRLTVAKGSAQLTAMKFSTPLSDFPYREGDTVDLAVRIEKNEFRGEIKPSVQIRDMRFSGMDDDKLCKSQALYEKYMRGEALLEKEARFITPSREFLLGVFGFLKVNGGWQFDTVSMLVRAKCPPEKLCTMLTSLDVLCELRLIRRSGDIIIFDGNNKKTDLSQSEILNKLIKMQGGVCDGN
ncbi:MAG: single-stranded-DNA-specific exonuclease RecJ [Oscillospiraceae bacterium]|nr:single-stranded-DNA-specific exonuclease RecJ [Oscillospiraceae bacterium]